MSRRCHPLGILSNTVPFLFLLVVPAVRNLLYFSGGFGDWLQGAWLDLLTLAAIVLLAFFRWWQLYYFFTPVAVHIHSGIFAQRTITIPFSQLTSLYVEEKLWYKPFGAVALRLDTDAGSARSHDAMLLVGKKRAVELLQVTGMRQNLEDTFHRQIYMSRNYSVVILSLISSNTFAGAVFASTLISQIGTIVGEQLSTRIYGTLTYIAQIVAAGIPPLGFVLAAFIGIGWLISFSRNVIRYYNFCVTRSKKRLVITGGVLTNREYSVRFDKVHYIDIQQTIFTKIFGLYSCYIKCAGYGKGDNIRPVLIPAAKRETMADYIVRLMPEFTAGENHLRPSRGSFLKFTSQPLCFLGGIPVAVFILHYFLPRWDSLIYFVGGMMLIPATWFLILRIMDYLSGGIAESGSCLTLRYSKNFTLHTIVVGRDKVCDVQCRQSVFQLWGRSCDAFITTYGEGVTRHHLRDMPYKELCEMLGFDPPIEYNLPFAKKVESKKKSEQA